MPQPSTRSRPGDEAIIFASHPRRLRPAPTDDGDLAALRADVHGMRDDIERIATDLAAVLAAVIDLGNRMDAQASGD